MTYNPIMIWLLYSPLHRMLSGITMVIHYTGRRTGKQYRLPVGYLRIGTTLLTVSFKRRTWWRNLRGGAEVTLRLQGSDVAGYALVVEDEPGVMDGIRSFIEKDPRSAGMFRVRLGINGLIDPGSLEQSAKERVIVRTILK